MRRTEENYQSTKAVGNQVARVACLKALKPCIHPRRGVFDQE